MCFSKSWEKVLIKLVKIDSKFNSKPKSALEKEAKGSSAAVPWQSKAAIVIMLDVNNSYSTGEESDLREFVGNKSSF